MFPSIGQSWHTRLFAIDFVVATLYLAYSGTVALLTDPNPSIGIARKGFGGFKPPPLRKVCISTA